MRTSYRLTPNQPRAVLAAVNGYLIRLPITTWPGCVIALWTAAAVAVGYSAPSLTRLAAEGQGKLLGKDAESQLAADGLSLAWPDQAYESLAVAAFYRADGLTANDIGCAKRLARRIEGGDHPAAVLRVLGPDSAPDIANRLFSGDGTIVLVATALSTSFVAPATHEAVAWLQSQVRADQLDVPDGLVVRWVGDALIGRDYMSNVQTSLDRAAVATVVLLLGVLFAVYRSVWLALVPLATIGASLVIAQHPGLDDSGRMGSVTARRVVFDRPPLWLRDGLLSVHLVAPWRVLGRRRSCQFDAHGAGTFVADSFD